MIWRLGEVRFDVDAECVRREGELYPLSTPAARLLDHLIQNRGRIVQREELLEVGWPGVALSDTVLSRCIAEARRAFGPDPSGEDVIASFYGTGYRFVSSEPPSLFSGKVNRWNPPEANLGFALEAVQQAFGAARESKGRLLLLLGDPDATHALGEQARFLARDAGSAVGSVCFAGEQQAHALDPWVEALGQVGALADVQLGSNGPDRFTVFDSIARALGRATRAESLLIVLEHVERASGEALDLLGFVGLHLRDTRLALLATLDPASGPNPALARLVRESATHVLAVEPLH